MGIRGQLRTMEQEDGAVVLDIQSGDVKTLNETGAYIWNALRHGENAETIADNLVRETGEDIAVVKHDVAVFLEALRKHKLLSL